MFSSFTKKTIIFLMLFSFLLTMGLAISEQQMLQGTAGVSESITSMAYAAEGDAAESIEPSGAASSDSSNESTSAGSTAGADNNDWAVSDWMYNNISIIVITVLGVLMCIYLYFSNRQK